MSFEKYVQVANYNEEKIIRYGEEKTIKFKCENLVQKSYRLFFKV